MPAYNAGEYVAEAINALKAQTFKDWELVLIDDGSADDTCSRAEQALHGVKNHKIITQAENQGNNAARNAGLRQCSGEFIALMDADDASLPRRLQVQAEYFKSNKKIGVLGGGMLRFKEGAIMDRLVPPIDPEYLAASLFFKNAIYQPSVMMRAKILEGMDAPWAPNRNTIGDYHLWWTLMLQGVRLHNFPQPLVRYRVHKGQIGARLAETRINAQSVFLSERAAKLGISLTDAELAAMLSAIYERKAKNAALNSLLVRLLAANESMSLLPKAEFGAACRFYSAKGSPFKLFLSLMTHPKMAKLIWRNERRRRSVS